MKIINGLPDMVVSKTTVVAMDVEMYGQSKGKLHRPTGTFACLSVCMDGINVYQIYEESQVKLMLEAVKNGTWVFHNALYDLKQLRRYAKIKPRKIYDTMLVDQSVYGGWYIHYGLQDLSRRWLKVRMAKNIRDEFSTATKMTADMKHYAAQDAKITWQIAKAQKAELSNLKTYELIDEPMIFPLLDMPGVPVDAERWKVMSDAFALKAKEIEEEIGVNSFSGQQVIKMAAKNGVHIRDTKAETLKAYKDNVFIGKVIKARMYRKAVSTYGTSWLEKNVEEDGLVYSSYHITGAETGRMSSRNPNMQQIPARQIPEYRELFVASPGNVLLVADVSQQEPRILAHESKDAALLDAFKSKEDLHLYVARIIFNDPKMKKDDPRRDIGKTINLGTSYGLSEYGLATRLNITEQEAAQFLRQYFSRFKDVLLWIGHQRAEAFSRGYVTTVSGRRVYMNLNNSSWQNNAINAPIQGGAADFTKMWVRKIWEGCQEAKLPFLMDRIVHDEVVLNVPKGKATAYKSILNKAFDETAKELFPDIPFAMEIKEGKSWACKKLAAVEDEGGDEE